MTDEIWKPVPHPSCDRYFEVSNMGRVRHTGGLIYTLRGKSRTTKPRALKPYAVAPHGKHKVSMRSNDDGRVIVAQLHNLVAQAFLPPPQLPGYQSERAIIHKNGDLSDNRAVNLQYKFSSEAKEKLKAKHAEIEVSDKPCKQLAAEYGYCEGYIRQIQHKGRRTVKGSPPPCEPGEIWEYCPGYGKRYSVSSLGRVWSNARPGRRVGFMMTQRKHHQNNYLLVTFHSGNKKTNKSRRVHQLVAEAFLGPRHNEDGSVKLVRHLNGDPADNKLVNLAYGTPMENHLDSVRHGTFKIIRDEWKKLKINREQAKEICSSDAPDKELAEKYGLTARHVNRIRSGHHWAHATAAVRAHKRRLKTQKIYWINANVKGQADGRARR